MNNLIVDNIKKNLEVGNLSNEIYTYLNFYHELNSLNDIQLIYTKLQNWVELTFGVKSLKIIIHSTTDQTKEIVYQNSLNKVYENTSLCKCYKIDINSDLNITFYLICNNQKQYDEIEKKDKYLSAFFYMISSLISNVSYQNLVKELIFKDPLTNIYNQKFLVEHLNKILPLAKKENKNVSFLMIEIDHFKAVIDEFNYDIRDRVLINLSNILQQNIRKSDLVARLEGYEFFVVLVGLISQKDAIFVAQKLIDTFAQSEVIVNKKGHVIKKTICVGVTHFNDVTQNIDDILKNANISLCEATNLGRGKIKEYIPENATCVELF